MALSQTIKDLIATAWTDGYPCLVREQEHDGADTGIGV